MYAECKIGDLVLKLTQVYGVLGLEGLKDI